MLRYRRLALLVGLIALGVCLGGASNAAYADMVDVPFEYYLEGVGMPEVHAQGTLTVDSGIISAITGTRTVEGEANPETITGLIAPGGYAGNDNVLLPDAPWLTPGGFSYTVNGVGDDAGRVNFFFHLSSGRYLENSVSFGSTDGFLSGTPPTSTPEPASLLLLTAGLIGFVAFKRTRRA